MAIKRIFVSKKPQYNAAAEKLKNDLMTQLSIAVEDLRIFKRYDVEGMTDEDFTVAATTIFSEPPVDDIYTPEDMPDWDSYELIAVELLPGQFDQRADSAAQCVQLLTKKERPTIRCATVYAVKTDSKYKAAISKYLVNPVEARLASLDMPDSLDFDLGNVTPTATVNGFKDFSDKKCAKYVANNGLAMSVEDLKLVRDFYKKEGRDVNLLELKVIDTYWSDHCRHTTFLTHLEEVAIDSPNPHILTALDEYKTAFKDLYASRPEKYVCLMDIATIAAKVLKKKGLLGNLDESEEINACSIKVTAQVNNKSEKWLVQFKNETHNHPTEIEPFGGAATCLGGAIRDPLSGRAYVYQSMRITGAADPRVAISKTLKGKLPQRVLSKTAAAGFSSYGNQIGLATGIVNEIYHPDFVAKRLETGFVVGACPESNVVRLEPSVGDIVVLIGGETGRDGCGGATGSSKAHSKESVSTCGAEVQKGNAPTERKLQRLFRNPNFTHKVKRCNDFGAGGVCVAIGELARGLDIILDNIPKKYDGLTATELAISESQERMAVVIEAKDLAAVQVLANEENLLATFVATVTDTGRMRMQFNNCEICNLPRVLLDSNGAKAYATASISDKTIKYFDRAAMDDVQKAVKKGDYAEAIKLSLADLNTCSRQGLSEMFDSTVGASTVLMPFGGKTQLVPSIAMAAKLPLSVGDTSTATVASWGYDPYLMSESPFVGSVYSIINSVTKVVLAGAPYDSVYLTLQEYFLRLGTDPARWGIPMSALLGAMHAQLHLNLAAIGGKDSMSGTFERIDVPPTLISFALGIANANKVITNVLTKADVELKLIRMPRDAYGMIDFDYYVRAMKRISVEIDNGNITYATAVERAGAVGAVVTSLLGDSELGFKFSRTADKSFFNPYYGDVIVSAANCEVFAADGIELADVGKTTRDGKIVFNHTTLTNLAAATTFTGVFKNVYPMTAPSTVGTESISSVETLSSTARRVRHDASGIKPRVLIPVFPGTNCEYDTARRFIDAGAEADVFVLNNLDAKGVSDSVDELVKRIGSAQMIAFSGGFSGGDEPDGSGKLIATTFRNPAVAEAVMSLLSKRDGLMIGICNGFQALVKLGLLPYGAIGHCKSDSPTLTFNNIGRHISSVVRTRVSSVMSPWLAGCRTGDIFGVPVSHGEGKFICTEEDYKKMRSAGQIFSQYVDEAGQATLVSPHNPNGSMYAVEGITSPDGRILGKMGHIERIGSNVMKNINENFDMKIFASGVNYFK